MILIDDVPLVEAAIFNELAADYKDMFDFDWDTAWETASEPIEPWQWEWRSPLRALQQQLIGSSDVTGWTVEAGQQLAAVLRDTTTMPPSLLELRAAETGLLPTVTGDPDAGAVSAEGDE